MPGFTQVGWKCVTNFRFKLQLVFTPNPDVFYMNYQNFLTQITSAIGATNFNVVSMNNIQQGSTNIDATVDTDAPSDSPEATQQFNSLQSTFSTGNSINGM